MYIDAILKVNDKELKAYKKQQGMINLPVKLDFGKQAEIAKQYIAKFSQMTQTPEIQEAIRRSQESISSAENFTRKQLTPVQRHDEKTGKFTKKEFPKLDLQEVEDLTSGMKDVNMESKALESSILQTEKATKKANAETKKMNAENKKLEDGLKGVNSQSKNFGDTLVNIAKRMVTYAIATGGIYAAMAQLGKGIQYIKDLDKEMTNIQMVTGGTDEETDALALSYNQLGKEMSVSTLEIAKGSLEFVRQGKTAEETATLIKNSTMMSKLGNMSAIESSEALTSIMNGFKLTAEETGEVVSKLVAIDNSAATSVKELATAMQYGASASKMVGIDFDHLAAYIKIKVSLIGNNEMKSWLFSGKTLEIGQFRG